MLVFLNYSVVVAKFGFELFRDLGVCLVNLSNLK
jgi:hypothetical protein